ncbi:MAG: hypothetical protein LGB78_07435 [Sulfurovum sp.]|nr:hypothetical protein [Sulfurovum sp.]MCB4763720.1 hypothetical protein [Sulfurovum sp.]MCB4779138.1 hypothetical protein [Sulfurovum sp.]
MKNILILLLLSSLTLMSENNESNQTQTEENATEASIQKVIEQEKKIAKEKKFYNADEYDFKGAEVDPKSLDKIKALEPDYDFDMSTGVYD